MKHLREIHGEIKKNLNISKHDTIGVGDPLHLYVLYLVYIVHVNIIKNLFECN